ncbi:MAG: glycosyltransferase [Acidobacteriaceae bacterium]
MAAFTGDRKEPSGRFRVRQYLPYLERYGISMMDFPSRISKYPPESKWLRPLWGSAKLAELVPKVIRSHSFDAVLLQREMVSTFVTLEALTKKTRILDVDDAIFLYRGGGFARRLAQMSHRVICGNSYLAEWFGLWNRNVTIIPTAVDAERHFPLSETDDVADRKAIGWLGTSGNLKYLYSIEKALAKVLRIIPNAQLVVVSDKAPEFQGIDPGRIKYIHWEEKSEAECIQSMDVGIMPLDDTPWARGKCSFKMLQYMACGLPVVVSPVGMNAEVLAMEKLGIGASTESQWIDALVALLESEDMRSEMGMAGRKVVEAKFSIDVIAPQLAACLRG